MNPLELQQDRLKLPPKQRRIGPAASLLRDGRAAAAVELALLLPFLILLIFGSMEFSKVYELKRRIAQIDTTLADLMGRSEDVDDNAVLEILAAAETIMVPYALDGLVISVTALELDSNGGSSVLWSRSSDGSTNPPPGIRLPAGLGTSKQVIHVGVSYPTTIVLGFLEVTELTLTSSGIVVPRKLDVAWEGRTGSEWSSTGWVAPTGSPNSQNPGTNGGSNGGQGGGQSNNGGNTQGGGKNQGNSQNDKSQRDDRRKKWN